MRLGQGSAPGRVDMRGKRQEKGRSREPCVMRRRAAKEGLRGAGGQAIQVRLSGGSPMTRFVFYMDPLAAAWRTEVWAVAGSGCHLSVRKALALWSHSLACHNSCKSITTEATSTATKSP